MNKFTDEQFELVINKYYKSLVIIANNYVRDNFASLDIVQDVFIKLYNSNKKFESEDHLRYWLIRVTINYSIDYLRKRKKEINKVKLINATNNPDVQSDKKDKIYQAILKLKDNYKKIIILYYYDNLNIKEIADILQISQTNAQTRLARARAKLKTILEEEGIYG